MSLLELFSSGVLNPNSSNKSVLGMVRATTPAVTGFSGSTEENPNSPNSDLLGFVRNKTLINQYSNNSNKSNTENKTMNVLVEEKKVLMVVCYTPNGAAFKVVANSPEQAKQLLIWNPKP